MSSAKHQRAAELKDILALIAKAGQDLLEGWECNDATSAKDSTANSNGRGSPLPSADEHKALNTLIGAGSLLSALLQEPSERLMAMSSQFFEARALHYVAKECIPDIVESAGPGGIEGVTLAHRLDVDHGKLTRIMRLLATTHFFTEVGPDRWTNNHVSRALVGNKELRAAVFGAGLVFYPLGNELLWHLCDPVKSRNQAPKGAIFCDLHEGKGMFEWLSERDEKGEPRMELGLFHLAMVGAGHASMPAILADYPWKSLGRAKVVDVGGGVGGACMALANACPDLKFVVQDRAEVVSQAREIWAHQFPQHADRIEFVEHDFFNKQHILDADIYFMRHVIHDWNDEKGAWAQARRKHNCHVLTQIIETAVQILQNLEPALTKRPTARLLIVDRLIVTTYGSDIIPQEWLAPRPLPANYGLPARTSHQVDMTMLTNLNSCERTPNEFKSIIEKAGLRLVRFWMCRSPHGIIEVAAP